MQDELEATPSRNDCNCKVEVSVSDISKSIRGRAMTFNPTPEQIEAAAETMWRCGQWLRQPWERVPEAEQNRQLAVAHAALVAAAGAAPQEAGEEDLRKAFREYLGQEMYWCSRDHTAWAHGTMSLDDFTLAAEDDDIVDSLVDIAQSVPVPIEQALRFCTCSHWLEAHNDKACLEFACTCKEFSPVVQVDEAKLADVLDMHVLGKPNGGTASWAWLNCSCGHRVEIAGVTREYVVEEGRRHPAREVAEWPRGGAQ